MNYISLNKLLELKFSKAESRLIIKILEFKTIDNSTIIATKLKNIWLEDKMYILYFIYVSSIVSDNVFLQKLYNKLTKLKLFRFPVGGEDILALGYHNREVGEVLDLMKRKWIDSDFTLTRLELISLIKNSEK